MGTNSDWVWEEDSTRRQDEPQSRPARGHAICPHLGMKGDPDTAYRFPAEFNCCHYVRPPAPVTIRHQEACCLTRKHIRCPVFRQPQPVSLYAFRRTGGAAIFAAGERHRAAGVFTQPAAAARRVILPLATLLVTGLLLLIAWQNRDALSTLLLAEQDPGAAPGLPGTLTPRGGAVLSPTMTITAGDTPRALPPAAATTPRAPSPFSAVDTATASASAAPTETLIATVTITSTSPTASSPTPSGTPCGQPPGWVIYVVRPGDTLFLLSVRYGVSMDSLRLANCLTSDDVFSGQRLWVPFALPVPTSPPAVTPSATTPPTATAPPPTATAPRPTPTTLPTPTTFATNPPPPPPQPLAPTL
jgi:LysM repeat protein